MERAPVVLGSGWVIGSGLSPCSLPGNRDNRAASLPVGSEFAMRGDRASASVHPCMRHPFLAALLVLGCAHRHEPRPPPLRGWTELRSTHFRLRTDMPPDSARETLGKLEYLRLWLQAAWSTGGDSPGSTNAIVLDDAAELWTFMHVPGTATTTRKGPIIVTAGNGG